MPDFVVHCYVFKRRRYGKGILLRNVAVFDDDVRCDSLSLGLGVSVIEASWISPDSLAAECRVEFIGHILQLYTNKHNILTADVGLCARQAVSVITEVYDFLLN